MVSRMTNVFHGVPGSPEYHRWREEVDLLLAQRHHECVVFNERQRIQAETRRQRATFILLIGLPAVIALAVAACLT